MIFFLTMYGIEILYHVTEHSVNILLCKGGQKGDTYVPLLHGIGFLSHT